MNIKRHLNNFLRYKYLLFELVKKNIKLKYRRSYLGILWTLVEPLLTMIVLTLVFGTLFGKDDRTYPEGYEEIAIFCVDDCYIRFFHLHQKPV